MNVTRRLLLAASCLCAACFMPAPSFAAAPMVKKQAPAFYRLMLGDFDVTVLYDFTGFFSPVVNQPTLNLVNAGRAVPVKFSLSGNKGLSIFAAGSPASQQINCSSDAPISTLDATTTAGSSSLSYDAASDQYNYVWKTDSSWAGQCRALVVTLNDGSTHTALFKFR